tara:strand:- start:456 stop:1838 length:1383 start_codon:yes stop_codon:yes gene_type:complete
MGNGLAYAVLALWPLLAIYWYKTKNINTATLWTIVGGFMFLPVKTFVDFPMIPPLGKETVPVIAALIGCLLIKKKKIAYFSELGNIKYLVVALLLIPFCTAVLNSGAVNIGGRYLPGLSYYDGLAATLNQFLLITPFFIGRQFFKTYEHQLLMFKFLVVAGLLYSIAELFEVRMSPQLHTWAYGYFPHSFVQQYRFGGFRPVVFMGHGLLVAFFTVVALMSAVALWKNKVQIKNYSPAIVSYYLFVVLIFCKSIASILFGMFGFFAIKFIRPKMQHKIAILLVSLAMLYPMMSIVEVFPHQTIINAAESMSPERAESIKYRFDNERILLSHAREHLFFGWGGWGRNRVYSEETGEDLSVTDGRWIITFGLSGLIGFLTEFGLLAFPVIRAYKASRYLKSKSEITLLAAHALLISIVMIDQLPNASLGPWLWLLAGILLGRSEKIIAESKIIVPATMPTHK